MQIPDPKDRLIVALDFDSLAKASPFVDALAPHVGFFKIGLELITAVGAPQAVQFIHRHGGKVFFDGKFSDIPNTVGKASAVVQALGVDMFNVHASCGPESLKAAADAKTSALMLVVTVLTSLDETATQHVFNAPVPDKVKKFVQDALTAGADGVVCSPQELELLGTVPEFKDLLKVTPGVRPTWAEANDQKRTMTPAEAIRAGATHLVVGRPITNPPRGIGNPVDAAKKILEEIAGL